MLMSLSAFSRELIALLALKIQGNCVFIFFKEVSPSAAVGRLCPLANADFHRLTVKIGRVN